MKKFLKIIVTFLFIFILTSSTNISKQFRSKRYITNVLNSEYYSYLPQEAKEYIKETYNITGEVILTEKNKEVNVPYLNPEYIEYLTYSDDEKKELDVIPVSLIVDYSIKDTIEAIDVPSSYDLRNVDGKNFVTPVRNQGSLGLCWSFASAEVAESYILKKANKTYTDENDLISERQIDYATAKDGIKDYKSEYVSFINRSLGSGGNFYISSIAAANGILLVRYDSFKEYKSQDLSKMELSDVLNYSKSLYELDSTIHIPNLNLRESTSILSEAELKTKESYLSEVKSNIMENGGAFVTTYFDSTCRYNDSNLNNTVIDVYNCNYSGGHALEIIGWDDDLEYTYCADTKVHSANLSNCNRIVDGKGVWILKNSWGDSIQYPYLTYDSLYTSIYFIDELTSFNDRVWDNNYVFDGVDDISNKEYYLSSTKIKDDEYLKRIKFITESPDAVYNVKIFNNDGSSKSLSKKTVNPGLITFDIEDDFVVDKNSWIEISSDGMFADKVSVFTSNIDKTPYIDLEKNNNKRIFEKQFRLYSETKNIPSNEEITYKLYTSNRQDVSDKISFSNNIVSENNVNTLFSLSFDDLTGGEYIIDAIYDSNVIASINVFIVKMSGLGTEVDPYVITNSAQLNQIRYDLDAYYVLANDIDLTEDTRDGGILSVPSDICPQGFGWNAINNFSGSLDGKGHSIKGLYQNNNLTCNEEDTTWYNWRNNSNGFFSKASKNATIKNLVLEDFDIYCKSDQCGLLVSNYISNLDENGYRNLSDKTEYSANFENIAVKNCKINGNDTHGGGLLGYVESLYGNINISNIYLDLDIIKNEILEIGYLASSIQGNTNIQNIRISGELNAKYNDGSGSAILIHKLVGTSPIKIKNVISTVTANNVGSSLIYYNYNDYLELDGINILNINDKPLCGKDDYLICQNATNVNIYDTNTQISEFINLQNGTASRESEKLCSDLIKDNNLSCKYAIVSEAGASIYSTEKVAIDEFPNLSPNERSAVSIGRRIQDPLSELVKIPPEGIGVGLYQHDVTEKKLKESLDFVVEKAVNNVGVNINTASPSLFKYISGLTKTTIDKIIKYRESKGKIKSREELKKNKILTDKAYEQSIGFMRIIDAENVFDKTDIHPESYEIAEKILNKLEISKDKIGTSEMTEKCKNANIKNISDELNSDIFTIEDILKSFMKPNRDPRDEMDQPLLKSDILTIDNLNIGMKLEGTVRNVIDFGAFIDIGLHNDGLVHISKMTNKYIKHPSEILSVGDIVTCYVIDINKDKEKVSLSLLNPNN